MSKGAQFDYGRSSGADSWRLTESTPGTARHDSARALRFEGWPLLPSPQAKDFQRISKFFYAASLVSSCGNGVGSRLSASGLITARADGVMLANLTRTGDLSAIALTLPARYSSAIPEDVPRSPCPQVSTPGNASNRHQGREGHPDSQAASRYAPHPMFSEGDRGGFIGRMAIGY
jgi:hypothetical protein